MITKKSEMAEWIFDFFRRSKSDTGHITMMRTIQNKLLELNPRERGLFVPVANELIANGYLTYEEGTPQCFRLTQKGREYIYSPGAELKCCQDKDTTPSQEQYIAQWHQNFTAYINGLKTFISKMLQLPEGTEEDKRSLARCLQIVSGSDAQDVEKALGEGTISKSIITKVEDLSKALVDEAVEHLQTDVLVKEFWRNFSYLKIEQETKERMNALRLLDSDNHSTDDRF